MDGAKVSFLHVSQNVPTDSPMEVTNIKYFLYWSQQNIVSVNFVNFSSFQFDMKVTMSKPKGSQIHVSQAVPRSRYLLFSFLDTISRPLVSLSLMIKIAQFFEVEAGRQCRRQYSSCQSGQNSLSEKCDFFDFSPERCGQQQPTGLQPSMPPTTSWPRS